MDRIRKIWQGRAAEIEYEPLANSETLDRDDDGARSKSNRKKNGGFYIEYSIFLLLGISMLWAWNMFLAASPYFQHRFRSNAWIFENFQAAEISVSTITNLSSMLILTRMQSRANYPRRIILSLFINMAVFALLATSTAVDVDAGVYFAFLMVMIFCTSLATGFCQNGVFAFVSGYGEPKFTQGIMTGQAVAGVLPCLAQIISVLSLQGGHKQQHGEPPSTGHGLPSHPPGPPPVNWKAAMVYFVTATAISVVTFVAFSYLVARNRQPKKVHQDGSVNANTDDPVERKSIALLYLLKKLFWLAGGVFINFAVTMVFPVYTQRIVSVRPPDQQPPILQPPSFIPLALLMWNIGDLLGRLAVALPSLSLVRRPRLVFSLAISRLIWIGGYHLCNIRGRGAVIESDFFYLVVIQLFFGMSNGFLGSTCMIGAGEWVEEDEREAAGGFMGLCLVGGLTVGSLLSFVISNA